MNFKDRLSFAYKALTAQNLGQSISGQVLRNYQADQSFSPSRQLVGITYKAIDKIGMSLSTYEPRVIQLGGDIYVNHPLYNLFDNPNPIQKTSTDFIHLYAMLFEIYGETFWYLVKGEMTNKIKEIYLLNPAQIELVIDNGELVGYMLHKNNGEQVPLSLDEIHHDKRPNPFNEWRGMSVMEKASTYIDTEINTARFTLNYIKNNASPSGIVSLPNMDREAFRQFAQQWREGYEGPENAGKTAFIRNGQADFKAVGATLKDIDQEITRKMAKDDVLMMLEVPKEILGMTNDSGFGRSTIEAFSYIYNKETIEPLMNRLDNIYEAIWVKQKGEIIEVEHESPVPEDKTFEHQVHKDLINIAITVNEVREELGYPPIEGGDDLPTTTGTVAPTDPNEEKAYKKKIIFKKAKSKNEIEKLMIQKKEDFRVKLMNTNEKYAKKIKRIISYFATAQENSVIDKINASSKAYEDWLYNVKEDSEELALLLLPVVLELIQEQSVEVANFITGEALEITPQVRKVVEVEMKQIAGVYNTDTLKALEKTITEGQTNNESLVKIKKRVESVYQEAKGYRAERIAKTEANLSGNRTAELIYSQNGYSYVEWYANPNACDFCEMYAGKKKEIGKDFINIGDIISTDKGDTMRIEYRGIDVPPLHPNCACSIVPSGEPAGA